MIMHEPTPNLELGVFYFRFFSACFGIFISFTWRRTSDHHACVDCLSVHVSTSWVCKYCGKYAYMLRLAVRVLQLRLGFNYIYWVLHPFEKPWVMGWCSKPMISRSSSILIWSVFCFFLNWADDLPIII